MDRRDREEDIGRDVRDAAERADAESREEGGRGVDVDRVVDDADAGLRSLAPSSLRDLYSRASRVELSRRRLLELLGVTAIGAGALTLSEVLTREYPDPAPGNGSGPGDTTTPEPTPSAGDGTVTPRDDPNLVNLGDRGLEDGDDITPFLSDAADGEAYFVPAGTYRLGSTTVDATDYAFVGEPGTRLDTGGTGYLQLRGRGYRFEGFTVFNSEDTSRNDFQLNVGGADWVVRNCGYEGRRGTDGYNLATTVTERGATGLVEGCYWPGVEDGSDTGWAWLNEGHRGNLLFRECSFVRGGVYGTKSTSPLVDGRVDFERCFFDSCNVHNIRLGTANRTCHVRNCVITVDPERVPTRTDGIFNPRGIWAWYGDTRVVDTDIAQQPDALAVSADVGGGRSGRVRMVGGNLTGVTEGDVRLSSTVGDDPANRAPAGVPTSVAEAVRRGR